MRTVASVIVVALAGCCATPSAPPKPSVVRGTVRAEGPLPKRKIIRTSVEPKAPAEGIPSDNLVVDEEGRVAWAFVWVKSGLEGRRFEVPREPAVLEQRGFRYQPHVLGVQVGRTLAVRNADEVLHAVHTGRDWEKASFMSGAQIPKGEERRLRIEGPEGMEAVRCDVHPWMKAWIGVVGHPFFAVTDTAGNFEIKDLPPGTYTLGVWHEELEGKDQEIVVKGPVVADFKLAKKAKAP